MNVRDWLVEIAEKAVRGMRFQLKQKSRFWGTFGWEMCFLNFVFLPERTKIYFK